MIAQSELELPSAWRIAKLKDVATIERNALQPEEISQGTSYLGLENIDSGGGALSPKIVEKGDLASSKFQFTNRHLLYGKLRPYLAKIACPEFKGICSTDILPILPGPKLDRQFLCYFLRQPSMVDYANSRAAGANLPRLSPATLEDFKIPVPPLAVQHRIAAVLDKANELRAKRCAALTELDTLTQSIFLEMFGDPYRNPKKWPQVRLDGVCSLVNGRAFKPEEWEAEGLPIIRIQNLNDPTKPFNYTRQNLPEKVRVRTGDILFSWSGTPGTSFGCFRWKGPEGWLNQHIFNVRLKPEFEGEFFITQVNLKLGELIAKAHGGVGLQHVTKGMIDETELMVPPIQLQREFARRVIAVEALKAKHCSALAELDTLFASLQHRAFRGEL